MCGNNVTARVQACLNLEDFGAHFDLVHRCHSLRFWLRPGPAVLEKLTMNPRPALQSPPRREGSPFRKEAIDHIVSSILVLCIPSTLLNQIK